jgi:hypothetical protein
MKKQQDFMAAVRKVPAHRVAKVLAAISRQE